MWVCFLPLDFTCAGEHSLLFSCDSTVKTYTKLEIHTLVLFYSTELSSVVSRLRGKYISLTASDIICVPNKVAVVFLGFPWDIM